MPLRVGSGAGASRTTGIPPLTSFTVYGIARIESDLGAGAQVLAGFGRGGTTLDAYVAWDNTADQFSIGSYDGVSNLGSPAASRPAVGDEFVYYLTGSGTTLEAGWCRLGGTAWVSVSMAAAGAASFSGASFMIGAMLGNNIDATYGPLKVVATVLTQSEILRDVPLLRGGRQQSRVRGVVLGSYPFDAQSADHSLVDWSGANLTLTKTGTPTYSAWQPRRPPLKHTKQRRRLGLMGSNATAITLVASLSAAVQAAVAATSGMATAVQAPASSSASAAAAVQLALSAQASVGAAVQQANTAVASLQAAVQAPVSASSGLAAAVQGARTAAASLDVAAQLARSATASLAAQVQAAVAVGASLDAYVQAGSTASSSLAAAVQAARTTAATTDAAVQLPRTGAASVDAALQRAATATAALALAVQAVGSVAASLSAQVQAGTGVGASLDAAVRQALLAVASVQAAVSVARSATASLGSVVAVQLLLSAAMQSAVLARPTGIVSLAVCIFDPNAGVLPTWPAGGPDRVGTSTLADAHERIGQANANGGGRRVGATPTGGGSRRIG